MGKSTTERPTKRDISKKPMKRPTGPPRAQKPWQLLALKQAKTEDATDVQRMYSLLSQLHRRNKNQHRGTKWWKWFDLLRRKVGVLVRVEGELSGVGLGVGGKGERLRAEEVRTRLERREGLLRRREAVECWVRDVLLGRCYLAFSTVVRDVQFANLGVVLVGLLARVGTMVGLPRVEVERVVGMSLRQTGMEKGEVVRMEYESPQKEDDDFGEVVERAAVVVAVGGTEESGRGKKGRGKETVDTTEGIEEVSFTNSNEGMGTEARVQEKLREPMPVHTKPKKARKGKKKDAIDDLFAGLV